MPIPTYFWQVTATSTTYNRLMSAVVGLQATVWGSGGTGGGSTSTVNGGGGGGGGAVAIKEYFLPSLYRNYFSAYVQGGYKTNVSLQPAGTKIAEADFGKNGEQSYGAYNIVEYQDTRLFYEDAPAWYCSDSDVDILNSVVVNSYGYTEVASLSACKSTEQTYYRDEANSRLYLHMPNGDPPDLWDDLGGDYVYHITTYYDEVLGAGGVGGLGSNSTGDTCYNGGDGASGQSLVGGGGGSSAGTSSDGNDATGQTGASAPTGGGPGGNGGNQGSNGSQPTSGTYGGGGGGGGARTTADTTGATGRTGKTEVYFYQMVPIMVSYTHGETV